MLTRLVIVAAFTLPALANNPPATPEVTEPPVGRIVNPADLHMECSAFSDPDPGDTHLCTDWEVWTITPLQRVWFTSCIGGVERLHTHMGDGVFQGSHAGRTEFLPNTQYRLRVRHRDSSGDPGTEWSGYGERDFVTGQASQVFPLELDDIADSPSPSLRNTVGAGVVLPPAGTPPSLRLESASGQLLLAFAGLDGVTNLVTNPPSIAAHVPIRVRVSAGSLASPLALPEMDLSFSTPGGTAITVYLPAMSVAPGAANDRYFWVATPGSTFVGDASQTQPDFSTLARGNPVPWAVRQPGYRVEVMASGFQLPVNIAFVPNPGPGPTAPLYYVTELYGTIKVVTRGGTIGNYATNLLNFNPTGNFPGSGEQGVAGVTVDPDNGDVYATMLYSSVPGQEAVPHYPKVVRFTSVDGGLTASSQTIIRNMTGESQGQSHQISTITFGPDGKLYVHMGDGFDASTAQNLASYRGKILRMNKDGSAPADNPFYDAADGISARDFVFAYGVRNPFGGAWRHLDGFLYEVENGPSVDRIVKVVAARNYLWSGSDASMANYAIWNWNPAVGPVNMAFTQVGTFGGSGFPAAKMDHMFISESGPTWATGPQTNGKRISEFVLDAAGNRLAGPTPLIEYIGTGKATACALAAGPDGLYFSTLYKDLDYASPIDAGAQILRVRFVGSADFTASVTTGAAPLAVQFTDLSTVPNPSAWLWEFGDGATSTLQHPSHVYADDGAYSVRLTVTGASGVMLEQKTGYIRVGSIPRVALIGVSMPPTAADAAVGAFLSGLGYTVTHFDDDPANRPAAAQLAADHDLILVSSTIASGNVAGQFRTFPVPMLFWENALLRTGREALTDNGSVVSATQINVLNNSHFITQGLPLGATTVYNAPSNMSVATGTYGSGVQVLARRQGSATEGALLAAEAGAAGVSYTMPARRVFFFLEDATFGATNATARDLLARSACWAINGAPPSFTQHPESQAVCPGNSVTLSATLAGTTPMAYQWHRDGVPIPGATSRTFTLNPFLPGHAGSYMLQASNPCGAATSSPAVLAVGGCPPCDPDVNCDGAANGLDVETQELAVGGDLTDYCQPDADFNRDGAVNGLDVEAVEIVVGGGPCP